ncbi:MAG: protein translocase subunit SecF [Peptococcaceae bacterium]|nr:protein translocase subunit SecF [Peptococcaceae bacterium]
MAGKTTDNKVIKNRAETVTPAAGDLTYDQVKQEHKLYFNIVKRRYIWFAISLLILIPGIISLFIQGLNLGIDFTGGTMLDIKFNQAVTQQKITKALESVGLAGTVQMSGDTGALIRTSFLEDQKRDELLSALQKDAGTFDPGNLKEDKVGPAIGAELRSGAVKAIALASILILLYVSVRFRFIYAVSGVVALLHDIFVTIGIFSIFQWQIDATFIAAILTVFGYSINDTVVIYDRIRENEKRMKKRDSFEDMVDKSVWQTMGRSIKTVGTVIIALFCIYILGGESTKVFALAMMIGVFSGAYSSIFTASQIVVEVKTRFVDKKKPGTAEA